MPTSIQILRARGWRWAGKSPGGNSSSNIFKHAKLAGIQVWLPWVANGQWQCCKRLGQGRLEFLASDRTHDLDAYLSEITPRDPSQK